MRAEHAFQRIVDEDPEAFARKLLAFANGAALVKAAELAAELQKSPFREREEELEQRGAALERRAFRILELEDWWDNAEAEIAALKARRDRTGAEVAELEARREALRVPIAAEIDATSFERVDEGVVVEAVAGRGMTTKCDRPTALSLPRAHLNLAARGR